MTWSLAGDLVERGGLEEGYSRGERGEKGEGGMESLEDLNGVSVMFGGRGILSSICVSARFERECKRRPASICMVV